MKRNPVEIKKQRYFTKLLSIKEAVPRLRYRKCVKCGNEYKREPMWFASDHMCEGIWGFQECFMSKNSFQRYAEEHGYIMGSKDFEEGDWRIEFILTQVQDRFAAIVIATIVGVPFLAVGVASIIDKL